jgi:hypothetical protein
VTPRRGIVDLDADGKPIPRSTDARPLPTSAVLASAEPPCFALTPCARHTAGLAGECDVRLSLADVEEVALDALGMLGATSHATLLATLRRVRVLGLQLGRMLTAGGADVEGWRALAVRWSPAAPTPHMARGIIEALLSACDAVAAARTKGEADALSERHRAERAEAGEQRYLDEAAALRTRLADAEAELRAFREAERGRL